MSYTKLHLYAWNKIEIVKPSCGDESLMLRWLVFQIDLVVSRDYGTALVIETW